LESEWRFETAVTLNLYGTEDQVDKCMAELERCVRVHFGSRISAVTPRWMVAGPRSSDGQFHPTDEDLGIG
jgi:hypothetical protein